MKLVDAINLGKSWGDKPCDHPNLEREISIGFSTGDYVCTKCGKNVDYDEWQENREKSNSNS